MAFPSDLARTKNWGKETLTDADLEGQFDLIINWVMASLDATSGHDHDGSANKGKKISPANLLIASQAAGDILYASSTTAWARLAKGTALQVLRMNSGATAPEWAVGGSADDCITRGFEISAFVVDATAIIVKAGVLYHGSTKVAVTSNTTLTFATDADWWDGAKDSYAGGAGWCYVGVDSSGNVKLLGANPPDCADTAGNTDGTLYYWYDGSLYWRVIGAVRIDTDNKTKFGQIQDGNYVALDVPLATGASVSADTWSGELVCNTGIPSVISKRGKFNLGVNGASVVNVALRPHGTTYATGGYGVSLVANTYVSGFIDCITDGTANNSINHYDGGASALQAFNIIGYYLNIR